ncbi:MAG TPA: alpha/beta hydrolase, partial [Gammaproteobacteria bacterium]|nr:alpha/beta hydrolase [Gammaproteobacteria bacterium]
GTKASYLESVCQRLGQAYVRFDYSGHGASSGKFEEGTIGSWLEDALCVLDNLTEGPQIIVGSSMGGWLMMLAALKRPDRIKALVGIASAPDFVEDLSHMQVVQEEVLAKNGIYYLPSRDSVTVYPITPHLITEGRTHSLLKAPIPIFCPVHLLHGLSDKDVPWQKSVKLAERLQSANVTVTLIKNGDHRLSERTHLALLEKSVYSLIDEAR